MKQDSHGFWLIKHGAFEGRKRDPYIFPIHVSQMRMISTCILLLVIHFRAVLVTDTLCREVNDIPSDYVTVCRCRFSSLSIAGTPLGVLLFRKSHG